MSSSIPVKPTLIVDFYRDWVEMLRARLVKYGDAAALGATDQEVEFRYFNVLKRAIHPRPRQVHLPPGFQPPPKFQADTQAFFEQVEKGENLNRFLSTRPKKADCDDLLLNDWGIHHFHVKATILPNGFSERSGPLLFARVTDDDMYVCGFFNHGAWEDYELPEIVHRHWPESLEMYRLPGSPASEPPSEQDFKDARRGGVQLVLQMLDGTLYGPIGGGISTARRSFRVVNTADLARDQIRNWESQLREWFSENFAHLEEELGQKPTTYSFKLEFDADGPFAVDHELKVIVRLDG